MSLAGDCCSVPVTQHNQHTTQNRKVNMRKTKKKNIKVRDLKPKKDAKGGGRNLLSANASSSRNAAQSASNLTARN
jgi:hypothetical protein